ncbi:CLIP domain-containing serine protease B4-like [Uranotaenia lowii]|uniref:CLIP domain-containing serine protease B4-like n=1 Tax=Uranotaenia lowii TaxID=190385 RepID=UPI00247A15C7|nr:CLIP domain-containing serine protease B4-like [Uranotaenia lowii]
MAITERLPVLLVLAFWLAGHTQALEQFDECRDGAGARGICVPLRECTQTSHLLMRGNLSDAERDYLKKSSCGKLDSRQAVCCPLAHKLGNRFGAPAALPAIGQCGQTTGSRIVGGEIAMLDDFPWLARIQYYKSNKRFGFHCGGVLINERYVLTAAHCIQSVPSSWVVYKIRLGEYDTENAEDCNYHEPDDCVNAVKDILVAAYYIHDDYYQENGADYNDIALIRMAETVEFTPYIQPICLPSGDLLKKTDAVGTMLTVAGWGQTENKTASRYKMYLAVPEWKNDLCGDAFSSANVDIVDSQLCAGGVAGKDSCRGDSGGPLMKIEKVRDKSAWFLKGIVSFGTDKCGTENIPGVYTRINKYIDWIEEYIEE